MALDLSSLIASRISMTWSVVLSFKNITAEVADDVFVIPSAWKSQGLAKNGSFCRRPLPLNTR